MGWRETVWFDPDGIDATGKHYSQYEAEDQAARQELDGLIALVEEQRELLVSVATGGPRIPDVDQEYRERRRQLTRRLGRLGLKDPFPWADLWQWYGYWSEALPGWASRRVHISELATPLLAELERRLEHEGQELEDWPAGEQVPVTWQAIDGRLMEMKGRLDRASSLDDLQDVGRRCREILIGIGRLIYTEAMLPEGATTPSSNDSKARITYYLDQGLVIVRV